MHGSGRADPPDAFFELRTNMQPLPRAEAQAVVDLVTVRLGQYAAVHHAAARGLLGDERFAALVKDKVRGQGPEPGYVFPWSVTDYLDIAGPHKPSKCDTCVKECK
jgi:hypothetical protein